MVNKTHTWNTTLESFLESSNENKITHDIFVQRIIPVLINRFGHNKINWLDVGPGNGDKLIECIKSLSNFTSMNLSICEPDFSWIPSLEIRIDEISGMNPTCYYNCNIEEINLDEIRDFDFVSMVHVLYNEQLKKRMQFLIQRAPKSLFWVQAESPTSDFHILRERLRNEDIQTVQSYIHQLEEGLSDLRIDHYSFETHGKIFCLDTDNLSIHLNEWFSAFLIGCDQLEFISYSESIKSTISAIVKDYVLTCRPDGIMQIEDKVLII